ncbi:DUF6470 family protein [Oceanobacillus halophilus]|uniref:YviE n=1 Tax=Oceanobacillus halophilus TaxID=930130 RepID=A0A495AAP6_9BACI|nr:DUF6470 family protein [Oceanobacillus halophilus]RKQ35576.1 hypothetical protein D8M06_04690 [Oceanobacillus halophilus]
MEFPQIRMQSQLAKIQMNQSDAKLEIKQPKADLSIQQPPAEVSIQTVPGKLQMDQTKAWEDMNLKHIFRLNTEFAQEGIKKAQEGTARRAREGTEIMRIENGGSPIPRQAVSHAFSKMKSIGIQFIPSHFSVQTNYQPADVQINIKTNEPIIEATTNKPIIHYSPGSLQTSLMQKAELDIEFVNISV